MATALQTQERPAVRSARDFAPGEAKWHAAGIIFLAPDGDVLLLRRSATETNYSGYWALPGGKAEDGESPEIAADREAKEELGMLPEGRKKAFDRRITPTGMAFHTFVQPVKEKFTPRLNDEHSGFAWCGLSCLPRPLHPGVDRSLREQLGIAEDMSAEDWKGLTGGFLKWAAEEAAEPEHAADSKVEKASVDYSPGKGKDRCRNCAHFQKGGTCEVVAGAIDPNYWCESFLADQLGGARYARDDTYAMDRSSVRTYDRTGRLHVSASNISKSLINPYRGREIPQYEALGLDPDRIYQLYRDPEELERAAPTFNNLPILSRHVPVTADNHQPDLVVGSTGTDASFEAPYLRNSLVVWARDAIDGIESESKKELSAAYHYRADMTPGSYQGTRYDGVMRDIVGNHVALVPDGRAGDDVVVGDSAIAINPYLQTKERTVMAKKPLVLSRKAGLVQGALLAFLMPRLAQDAQIDLSPALEGLTSKNFKERKAKIIAHLKSTTKDRLAQDASLDDVTGLLDALEAVTPEEEAVDADPALAANAGVAPAKKPAMDADATAKVLEMLKGKCTPEELEQISALMGGTAQDAESEEDKKKREDEAKAKDEQMKSMVTKPAMDAAIDAAVKKTRIDLLANAKAVREAERVVRPYVGDLAMAHDSAEEVYRTALTTLGVKVEGTHADALPAILAAQPLPGDRKAAKSPALAMDAAAQKGFAERIPGASRIGQV